MAHFLKEYVPPEFYRAMQGITREDLPFETPVRDEREENCRDFLMANFIYACVDTRSADGSDYTDASSAYLPATASGRSISLRGYDAHLPAFLQARPNPEQLLCDERVERAVRVALPLVQDVRARPSARLPEMGVWACEQCDGVIDPWHLSIDNQVLLASHLGVGDLSGVVRDLDGSVRVDRDNPWLFWRCVDCLGWDHYAAHLKAACITFWYPSPAAAYTSSPGFWWDEARLSQNPATRPVLLETQAIERTERHNIQMWKAKKMLGLAKAGAHSARFHITEWRRNAVRAREQLVRDMFQAGRSIVDVGLALVARLGEEKIDPHRARWEASRDEYRAMRREWEGRRDDWCRMYI